MKFIRAPYGFTMLPLIIFMFFVVGLLSAGVLMLKSKVSQGKQRDTLAAFDSIAGSVIQWSAASRTLPPTLPTALGSTLNPTDPWGKNIIFIFDSNLTALASGGICGRTTTNLAVNGTANTAFALLSAGNNGTLTSNWGGIPALNIAGPLFAYPSPPAGTIATLIPPNLFKIVTLEELKNRAGCYGTTQGRLKIVNNELPNACAGSATYPGTLFGDGGVPGYTWSKTGGPAWINTNPAGVVSPVGTITAATGTYPLTIRLTDAHAPVAASIQKTFNLKVVSCGAAPINFNNLANDFSMTSGNINNITIDTITRTINLGNNQSNGNNGYGCLWYKFNQTLAGKTFRGYFDFKMIQDVSAASTTYGDGFTFAIMQGANPPSVCGGANEALGYGTKAGHSIPGESFAVEFDTYPHASTNDPANYNHVAVVKGSTVRHNGGGSAAMGPNPICTGAIHPGCYYINPISWMENGATHKARIEVATGCNAACGSCGLAPPNSNALVKVWIDCVDSSCSTLTTNFIAEAPSLTHCMPLPASMNDIKLGFTEATWGATQSTIISNFSAGFY